MQRLTSRLSLVVLACGCGNVHTPQSADFAEVGSSLGLPDASSPDASSPDTSSPDASSPRAAARSQVITVRFPNAPSDLPREHLRAALVWTEGREPYRDNRGPDTEVEWKALVTSDVEVAYASPLELQMTVEAPDPHGHLDYADSEFKRELRDTTFYTLPTAEVVLYHDANHNGSLDLLRAGERGPGPDQMLALSSGYDLQGSARRALIVHKRAPLSLASYLLGIPGVSSLWLPHADVWSDTMLSAGPFPEDGLYTIALSVHANDSLAQLALLGGYTDMPLTNFSRQDLQYRSSVLAEIYHAEENSISLYKVDPDRVAWLPRGCMPWITEGLTLTPLPPPGAAIQCGIYMLMYSSSPDDYCGQAVQLEQYEWMEQTSEPWPCDERGLIEGTSFVASSQRLDDDPLLWSSVRPLVGTRLIDPPADFRCDKHIIYDFDENPAWHLPSIAPEPGSQVKCYDSESFSYIPPRKDGCNFKFSYELTSEYYGATDEFPASTWNLRAKPPEWWPCDDAGQLRPNTPYEAPRELEGYNCEYKGLDVIDAENPPPPSSQVRCLSDISYKLRPLWSDACDGSATVALAGGVNINGQHSSWAGAPSDSWPCDKEGKLKVRKGLSTY